MHTPRRLPAGSKGLTLALVGGTLLSLAGCRGTPPPEEVDLQTKRLLLRGEDALREQHFALATAYADSAAARAPTAVEPDFLKGLIFAQMMQWGESDAAYRRVVERDPDFEGVWNNLGNNAMRRGEYRNALAYFYRELEGHPAPTPWTSIGHLYRELGVVDSAAYAFEQARSLDGGHVPAYLAQAQLFENEGDFEPALRLLRDAYALAPDDPEARYRLGALLAKMGEAHEAIPYLEAVVRAVPWHNESHYALARALQQVGQVEESRRVLARAEQLWAHQSSISSLRNGVVTDPDNPFTHAALATAYRTAGRYEEAIDAYHIALALAPDNLEFQNNLASLHFLQHDTLAAIETYRRITDQDPGMIEAWLNLGVLHALAGEAGEARRAWRQVLATDPGNEKARAFLARLEARQQPAQQGQGRVR